MGTFRDIEFVTARQMGRITRAQLHLCGITDSMIRRWIARGILIPRLPKVYAVGHIAPVREALFWEAILYAGPGAMLSHLSAARHRGLIRFAPITVQVSTPRRIGSLSGIEVHARRHGLARDQHDGLPVTDATQTLLDLAAQRPDLLPRALGQLDYQRRLDLDDIASGLRPGRLGGAELRRALDLYDPAWADLNDVFEIDFHALCREWGVEPLPIPNVEVAPRLHVDALWPEHRLGVELDGYDNHRSRAQLLRDAERDLICRELGLTIIRYRRAQLTRSPGRVRDDLLAQLAQRKPRPQPVG